MARSGRNRLHFDINESLKGDKMKYLVSLLIVGLFATVSQAQHRDFGIRTERFSEYEYGVRKEMVEVEVPFKIRRDFEVKWVPTVTEVGVTEIPCPTTVETVHCPTFTTRTKTRTRTRSHRFQRNGDRPRLVQLGMINLVDSSDDDDVFEAGNFQRRARFGRIFRR